MLLARSIFNYHPVEKNDEPLRLRIREIALTRVRYGFWRIFTLIRREGWMDNHKRVYRLYKIQGLNWRSKRPRRNRAATHRLDRVIPGKMGSFPFCVSERLLAVLTS